MMGVGDVTDMGERLIPVLISPPDPKSDFFPCKSTNKTFWPK